MRIRKKRRNEERELPKAGMRTGGLHTSGGGIELPPKRENSYKPTQENYRQAFTWKHFDKW